LCNGARPAENPIVPRRYIDPLDTIWLATAERCGLRIERSREVFASWDGQGTLRLADDSDFDPDDSLAQLIFHEICHALVEGPEGLSQRDWGLENLDHRDVSREHACHRVQATLAQRHGLRAFFTVTTEWRPYYLALPDDPLADGDDPAIPAARDAHRRAVEGPWAAPLEEALTATAAIHRVVRPFVDGTPDLTWSED